ncbi:MAG TPA: hypothetical protein VIF35_20520 [Streptosporangiaceae bacterium]|jgi:hypothetical protein
MRRNIGARRVPGFAVLAPIAAGTLIGLAGCGSVPGGASASGASASGPASTAPAASAGIPLCAAAHQLDQVMMRLTSGPARAMLPRTLTITDAARVRALAGTLCTLPRMTRGLHCPAALGSALLLDFSAAGRAYPPVRIQDSGCATVTGVGPARQWSWSSRPGRVLSAAVGGKGRLVPGTYPSSVPTQ